MKKLLLATSLMVATAAPALADRQAMGTITHIEPNYRTVWMNVPRQECSNVEVPIYGTVERQGNAAEGALLGMIFGGIAGKAITGKDDGAAVGAIMGGVVGADKGSRPKNEQVITGYRTEHKCREVIVREQQREIKNYLITFKWDRYYGQTYTYNNYQIGDRIPVNVTIQAK